MLGFRVENLQLLKERLKADGFILFDESNHPYGSWAKVIDLSGNRSQLGELFNEE